MYPFVVGTTMASPEVEHAAAPPCSKPTSCPSLSTKQRRSPAAEDAAEALTEVTKVTRSDCPRMRALVLASWSLSPCAAAPEALSGLEELAMTPTARVSELQVVFLFGGSHERSCQGKLLFPAVRETGGGRVRSVA
jgi:hypothetical protein